MFTLEELETPNFFGYAGFYTFIAETLRDGVFVEVGCYKGHSLVHLAKELKRCGGDFKVYAVDLWIDMTIYNQLRSGERHREIFHENLRRHGVDDVVTVYRECSWEAARHFADRSLRFVFIDADHSYEAVSQDIDAWLPKVAPGGIIAGHDYNVGHPEVTRAVDERFPDPVNRHDDDTWWVQL